MTNDRFIFDALAREGERWHKITTNFEPDSDGWMWSECICGDRWYDHSIDVRHLNPEFSTWSGFGWALVRCPEKNIGIDVYANPNFKTTIALYLYDDDGNILKRHTANCESEADIPIATRNALYDFLKERGRG